MDLFTRIIQTNEILTYFTILFLLNIVYFILCYVGRRDENNYTKMPLFVKFNSISVWMTTNAYLVSFYLFIKDGHMLSTQASKSWIIGTIILSCVTVLKRTIQKTTAIKVGYRGAYVHLNANNDKKEKEDPEEPDHESVQIR